jgi:ATP-dependent Lhr-like helicase
VVCSTSLELGVDFDAVDQVLLVGAPRGVSRAVQRLGRSGHRVDGVARGWLLPLSLPDVMECIALRAAVRAGRLDALRVPAAPLDVLAQVLLGMAVEREWGIEEAYELVRRAGPYRALERSDYLRVLEYLAGGGRVLGGSGRYGKIVIAGDRFRVASRRTARSYYLNIGTISDDYHVQVLARGNRRLGAVEESFVTTLGRGEAFVIGGQTVKVKRLHQNTAIVEPAAGERVKTPRWMGGRMSLTARLAEEERALRGALRSAWDEGGRPACERVLRRNWKVDASTARRAGAFLERQCRAAPIPVEEPAQVERLRRGRSVLIVFHVVAGRGVNRSLAWVCGRRLGTEFGSVVANYDDHAFLLSLDARRDPGDERLRACFDPRGWREDLRSALQETEALGRKFRPIAETGQLLERRTARGPARARSSTWSGSLLYETFLKYEPDHPLLREAVREVLEDELDAGAAEQEAARLFTARWEGLELERPSPFSLPLFAAFNRETLLAQDPDRALEELTGELYAEWA